MITDLQSLRALYPRPGERALRKQLAALDRHCMAFIALSPFVVLSTADAQGRQDASPRGGTPGFVRVDGAQRLHIPDAPGNHRLDSLSNIVSTGRIGLLFLVPGVDETLRVNGSGAPVRRGRQARALCRRQARAPGHRGRCRRGLPALRQVAAALEAVVRRGARRALGAADDGQDDQRADRHRRAAETQDQMLARYAADL